MATVTEKTHLFRIELLPILLALFLLSACHRDKITTDHPDIFDAAFKRAEKFTPEKAIAYIDSTYSIYPDASPGDLYKKYHYLSVYYHGLHDYQKAMMYADSILYVIDHADNAKKYNLQYAEANLLKGDILFDEGLYGYAYQYFYPEKRIMDNKIDSCDYNTYMAHMNGRLAVINYRQGDYKRSVFFYKQSLEYTLHNCASDFNYYCDMQGTLSNLAFSYERLGVPDSTLYYYNMCLDFFAAHEGEYPDRKKFTSMAKGVVYGNLGDAYMMKGDLATADSLYKKDIAINSQKGYYNQDALITTVKLAKLYLKMGKLADAGTILKGLGSANNLDYNDTRISFLQTRAEYYRTIGQDKAAIEDLRYYIALKDSAKSYKEQLGSTNINNVFQTLEQEKNISSLKKQSDLKTILLIASILFLLMGIVIIALTIKNNKQVKLHADEVKKRNKEQQFALVALELRNRENARLTSVLAHDLKNPIHAIASIASVMLYEEKRAADDVEMLELIKESVANLSDIIDDVLINRSKSGAIVLNKEPKDLAELLKHSVSLLQFKAKEKEQSIQFEGESNIMAEIDSDQVWRVINNLLVNAIKFSPHNTTIKVGLKKLDEAIEVSVADEGIGIPDDFGNKIFDLFTKTKRTGTEGEETFGLGLYISRHIIEAHGGRIWFEHAPVKGTIFYVALPTSASPSVMA